MLADSLMRIAALYCTVGHSLHRTCCRRFNPALRAATQTGHNVLCASSASSSIVQHSSLSHAELRTDLQQELRDHLEQGTELSVSAHAGPAEKPLL